MFWLGFVVGILVGVVAGNLLFLILVVRGLVHAADRTDH